MSKLKKITSLFCAFAFVFFCFSGCSFSLTTPGGTVNNPLITRYDRNHTYVQWIAGEKDDDGPPTLSYADKQNVLTEYSEEFGINAVRTASVPVAGTTTGYSQTDAERARFYSNVIEQYEVIAKYILTTLVGNFGMGHNETSVVSSSNHTFYDDPRVVGDYALEILPTTPQDRTTGYAFDTSRQTIDKVVVGWTIDESDIETPQGSVLSGFNCDLHHAPTPVYSTDYAWALNLNGVSVSGSSDYLQKYLQKYLQFVTMRLIEIDLQLPATQYAFYDSTTAKQRILNYIIDNKVVKLGLNLDSRKGAIENMINTEVIGKTALDYDTSTKTFQEPSFVANYTYETGDTDPDTGDPITETIPIRHFADINKNLVYDSAFTVTSNMGFYCDFASVVSESVNFVVEASKEFPNVFAVEVTDFAPEDFYNIGQEVAQGERQVLLNLPYAQYQSVAFLCADSWQFDTLYLAVSANTSFVLKTYLRLVVNGNENIVHIANLNVDAETSWTNTGEQQSYDTSKMTEEEIIQLSKQQSLDAETKRNFLGIDLSTMLDSEQFAFITAGQSNSSNLVNSQYQTGTNRLGYHTNAVDNIGLSPIEDSSSLNVNDEQTYIRKELSNGNKQFALNNKNSTFFEILFEVEDTSNVYPFTCLFWTEFFGDGTETE